LTPTLVCSLQRTARAEFDRELIRARTGKQVRASNFVCCPRHEVLNSRLQSEKAGASARPCNSPLLGSRAGQGRGDVQGDLLPDGHVRCTSRTRLRDPEREENHLPVVQGASQGERGTQQERRAVALAPVLSAGSESHPRLASNACFQLRLADTHLNTA
jgi:hypothetical protein